jgi:hypothetical protein
MPVTADYYSIAQAAQAPVTLVNGSPTVVAATPVAVPQRCLHVQTGEGAITALIQAAAPRGAGGALSSWAITSAPIPEVGVGENQPLAVTARGDVADHDVLVSYGNPYPGETDVLQIGAAVGYKLALAGAAAITIYSSVSYYDVVHADASCPVVAPQLPLIAFANAPSIAGMPLTADDQPIALDRSAPVPVHVEAPAGTELLIFLQELAVANGSTAVTNVATFFPLGGDFAIDPSLLTAGHTYMFFLQTRRGFPSALDFDYRTVTYPVINTALPSTTFTITR